MSLLGSSQAHSSCCEHSIPIHLLLKPYGLREGGLKYRKDKIASSRHLMSWICTKYERYKGCEPCKAAVVKSKIEELKMGIVGSL